MYFRPERKRRRIPRKIKSGRNTEAAGFYRKKLVAANNQGIVSYGKHKILRAGKSESLS